MGSMGLVSSEGCNKISEAQDTIEFHLLQALAPDLAEETTKREKGKEAAPSTRSEPETEEDQSVNRLYEVQQGGSMGPVSSEENSKVSDTKDKFEVRPSQILSPDSAGVTTKVEKGKEAVSSNGSETETEEDQWGNRGYEVQQWGCFARNPYLLGLRWCCSRNRRSIVAWIASQAIISQRQNTWSVWLGDKAHKPASTFTGHYRHGHYNTLEQLEQDEAQAAAAFNSALEALAILEKEIKEAARAGVQIRQVVIVTDSDTLSDYICGLMYTETLKNHPPELDDTVQKLAHKVKSFEEAGLVVLFHAVAEENNPNARELVTAEVERCMSMAGIVSTSKISKLATQVDTCDISE
jgi:hypothetical protein